MRRYLYTVSNGQTANSVVAMAIQDDGGLRLVGGSPFLTGGKGSKSSQSQNSVWIDGRYVYAVDFGSDSFAIFGKNLDGSLVRVNKQPVPSEGNCPCSVYVSNGVLYVVNQGIRSSGGKARTKSRSICPKKRRCPLSCTKQSQITERGIPTQAIVNPQGTVLAVPSVRNRRSFLHCYSIKSATLQGPKLIEYVNSPFEITNTGYGFGSAWNSNGTTLLMTNAIGDGSVGRLSVDPKALKIVEKARAHTPGSACWSALSQNGKRLYVTNLLSLLVLDVSGNGLRQIQSLDVTDVKGPVLRDLSLGPSGKHLYALEQRKRRILIYSVGSDGLVTLQGEFPIGIKGYTLGLALG